MSDFVDDDDIACAPVNDVDAFVHYAKIATERFNERAGRYIGDQNDWDYLNAARMGFHSYILGVADAYGISAFEEDDLNPNDYGNNEWRRFKSLFDVTMTKLLHAKARAGRTDNFLLTEVAKEGIRKHLSGLRKYITESDLPEKTKKKLLDKVDEFETALHKRQMSMTVVYAFAGFVIGHLADFTTVADSNVVHKLLNNVFHVANEEVAKTEEVTKLMAPKPPLQITHDRPKAPARTQPAPPDATGPRESFSADLDDEIPF